MKLVFQNILAGQELQTASLAIYESEDVAREKSDAVASLLAHSRKLGAALCKNSAQLSRHNTQEQLRVNNAYREIFTDAQKVFSQVYTQDFDSTFQPHDGWHSFEQSFVRDAIGTMKKNDPFWEVEK